MEIAETWKISMSRHVTRLVILLVTVWVHRFFAVWNQLSFVTLRNYFMFDSIKINILWRFYWSLGPLNNRLVHKVKKWYMYTVCMQLKCTRLDSLPLLIIHLQRCILKFSISRPFFGSQTRKNNQCSIVKGRRKQFVCRVMNETSLSGFWIL